MSIVCLTVTHNSDNWTKTAIIVVIYPEPVYTPLSVIEMFPAWPKNRVTFLKRVCWRLNASINDMEDKKTIVLEMESWSRWCGIQSEMILPNQEWWWRAKPCLGPGTIQTFPVPENKMKTFSKSNLFQFVTGSYQIRFLFSPISNVFFFSIMILGMGSMVSLVIMLNN